MSKKVYKLIDIEKILTHTPRIFLLILAMIATIFTHIFIEYQQSSKIDLLTQKEKFESQKLLDLYIDNIHTKIDQKLDTKRQELNKSVHIIKGIYTTTRYKELKTHIRNMEQKYNIKFLLFDKDLHVYYGKIAKELDLNDLLKLLKDGSETMSWKNDTDNSIQLSYFDTSFDKNIYIGAFSLVDNLKKLTINELMSSIKKDSYNKNKYYFWINHTSNNHAFNIKNQYRWKKNAKIDKNSLYHDEKEYKLRIGITPNQKYAHLSIDKIKNEHTIKKGFSYFIIFVVLLILLISTTIFSNFVKKRFAKYNNQLEGMVKNEIAKNEEKQKILIQQNKLASMGEMIGNIAHQWRQPLNNISLIIHFIRDTVKSDSFDKNKIDNYVDTAKEQITYMSDTIDDFSNFYKPTKTKEIFSIESAIKATFSIMQTQININNITVNIKGKDFEINGYENEFKQALLNILSNAKDAIKSKKLNEPSFEAKIDIELKDKEIFIFNNGGNATQKVIERMFEPYFTTKFENKGTGIGLYMTKTIIETNMKGCINAKNLKDGVVFNIKMPT